VNSKTDQFKLNPSPFSFEIKNSLNPAAEPFSFTHNFLLLSPFRKTMLITLFLIIINVTRKTRHRFFFFF